MLEKPYIRIMWSSQMKVPKPKQTSLPWILLLHVTVRLQLRCRSHTGVSLRCAAGFCTGHDQILLLITAYKWPWLSEYWEHSLPSNDIPKWLQTVSNVPGAKSLPVQNTVLRKHSSLLRAPFQLCCKEQTLNWGLSGLSLNPALPWNHSVLSLFRPQLP